VSVGVERALDKMLSEIFTLFMLIKSLSENKSLPSLLFCLQIVEEVSIPSNVMFENMSDKSVVNVLSREMSDDVNSVRGVMNNTERLSVKCSPVMLWNILKF
jgi:hypothetical protein